MHDKSYNGCLRTVVVRRRGGNATRNAWFVRGEFAFMAELRVGAKGSSVARFSGGASWILSESAFGKGAAFNEPSFWRSAHTTINRPRATNCGR